MDSSEKRGGIFGVSGGDAAPSFEVQESVFNQMAGFVQVFIIRSLNGTVFLRRNDGLHVLFFGLFQDRIAVIAAISQQIFSIQTFNQAASLCAIRSGTLRDNNSERHTMRIHGQVYLGVEPPFVTLMS